MQIFDMIDLGHVEHLPFLLCKIGLLTKDMVFGYVVQYVPLFSGNSLYLFREF